MKNLENARFSNFYNEKLEFIPSHGPSYMEVYGLVHIIEDHDNHWQRNEEFIVYANDQGIGFHHIIPAGYGTYTYDPIENFHFYYLKDFETFLTFALTMDQREFLSSKKRDMIREKLAQIWAVEEIPNAEE